MPDGTTCCNNLQADYDQAISDAYNDRQYEQTQMSNALAIPDYDLAESIGETIAEIDASITIMDAEKSAASSGCSCWS